MLSSFWKMLSAQRAPYFPEPAPDVPVCVIGDVHGSMPLLERMMAQLPQDHKVVLVGDYIDRGEHTCETLRYLSARPDLTCLMGNHEEMLLQFLQAPEHHGGRWIKNGGLQTLASFGIADVRPRMTDKELIACRDRLRDTMGVPLIRWLQNLNTSVQTGNVLIVHAGADPRAAAGDQLQETMIWGHPDFSCVPRRDGIWVVHGHTIVPIALAEQGRIAIDTGAYASGRLSAVCLDGSPPRFITVTR